MLGGVKEVNYFMAFEITLIQRAMIRAGRFLGILVVPWYWNQMIRVSSKFQRNDIIDFGIIVVYRV